MDFLELLLVLAFVLSITILCFYLFNYIDMQNAYIISIKKEVNQLEINSKSDAIRFTTKQLSLLNRMSCQLGEIKNYNDIIISMSIFEILEYFNHEESRLCRLIDISRECVKNLENRIYEYQDELNLTKSLDPFDDQAGIYSDRRFVILRNQYDKLKKQRNEAFSIFKLYSTEALKLLLSNGDDEDNFNIQLIKSMANANITKLTPMPLDQSSLLLIDQEICLYYLNHHNIKNVELKLDFQQFNSLVVSKYGASLIKLIFFSKNEFDRLSNLEKERDELLRESSLKKDEEECASIEHAATRSSATKKHEDKAFKIAKLPQLKNNVNRPTSTIKKEFKVSPSQSTNVLLQFKRGIKYTIKV